MQFSGEPGWHQGYGAASGESGPVSRMKLDPMISPRLESGKKGGVSRILKVCIPKEQDIQFGRG